MSLVLVADLSEEFIQFGLHLHCISVQYQPRYSYLILKDDRFLDTFFSLLGEKSLIVVRQ